MLFRIAGDNDVRPQIKIVSPIIPPFSSQIASTLWAAVRNERLMLGRLPEQTWSVLSRRSLAHQRPANAHAQLHGNSGRRRLQGRHGPDRTGGGPRFVG